MGGSACIVLQCRILHTGPLPAPMTLRQAICMIIFLFLAFSLEVDADMVQSGSLRGAVRAEIQTNSTFPLASFRNHTSQSGDISVELCKYLCGSEEGAGCED